MEVTHNKFWFVCCLSNYPKFQSHWATSKNCSIEFILGQICFLHHGTQLEGEKCKFQKLQNKDHPIQQFCVKVHNFRILTKSFCTFLIGSVEASTSASRHRCWWPWVFLRVRSSQMWGRITVAETKSRSSFRVMSRRLWYAHLQNMYIV